MNGPIKRVALACLLMFALLLGMANYVQAVKAEDYRNHPRNFRTLVERYSRDRGDIVVEGKAVAYSQPTKGILKYQRRYPEGPLYAPVTGFRSMFNATGVEAAKDRLLDGSHPRLAVRRFLDLVTNKEPKGANVTLTIRRAAQEAAYDGLRRSGRKGAVVAIEPKTGAILALAALPSYDPSPLAGHDSKKVTAAYKKLEQDDDQPLLNRALAQTYPPGSTFKVVTAAAALSNGATPQSKYDSPRALRLPQSTRALRNFGGGSCGANRITLTEALRISCNTAFANVGLDVGADALAEQAQAFGVGERLEVPTPVAESVFPSGIDRAQTALSAIGQFDVRLTPLQAAMIAAGIANEGKVMRPHMVSKVEAPGLVTLDEAQPEVMSEAVSPEVAGQLRDMMVNVVERGTARNARIDGVTVAGKTGTAQTAQGRNPHAWFLSFAPAEDPQVAVAVIVESGGNVGSEATGGRLAAPIARQVMEAVMGV